MGDCPAPLPGARWPGKEGPEGGQVQGEPRGGRGGPAGFRANPDSLLAMPLPGKPPLCRAGLGLIFHKRPGQLGWYPKTTLSEYLLCATNFPTSYLNFWLYLQSSVILQEEKLQFRELSGPHRPSGNQVINAEEFCRPQAWHCGALCRLHHISSSPPPRLEEAPPSSFYRQGN